MASKKNTQDKVSAATLKRAQGIVDAVLAIDGNDRASIAQYWVAGSLFNEGKVKGDWSSEDTCLAVIKDNTDWVISKRRVNNGAKVATKFATLEACLKAWDTAKFGTSIGSFLAFCGVADSNAAKKKTVKPARKVSAKNKGIVTTMATLVDDADLRKALLALIK